MTRPEGPVAVGLDQVSNRGRSMGSRRPGRPQMTGSFPPLVGRDEDRRSRRQVRTALQVDFDRFGGFGGQGCFFDLAPLATIGREDARPLSAQRPDRQAGDLFDGKAPVRNSIMIARSRRPWGVVGSMTSTSLRSSSSCGFSQVAFP